MKVVTFLFFINPCRPFQSWSTTFCLRAWDWANSITGASTSMPNSLAPVTVR